MFKISDVGRENLEAILTELSRAANIFPPLYHDQLLPWSEMGQVGITEDQWQLFIDVESKKLDHSQWWEWDGPYSETIGFHGLSLGRWWGHPEGMKDFANLVDSITTVLEREDLSHIDNLDVPFAFRTFQQWVSTLHFWAFRFQMPLLRTELTVWGAEDSDPADFFELCDAWDKVDSEKYPLHPVCWTFIDNVFTSSATAIRAILRPENVISTNEPWPRCSLSQDAPLVRTSPRRSPEDSNSPMSDHRVVEMPYGWTFIPSGSVKSVHSTHQAGLHRIAVLIDNPNRCFQPEKLAEYGARPSRSGRKVSRREVGEEFGITMRSDAKMNVQEKDDVETLRAVGKKLLELQEARDEAQRSGDMEEYEETERQIDTIMKQFHVTSNGTVKPQRGFRDPQVKRAKDTVSRTIKIAIGDLKKQVPEAADDLERLLAQITFSEPTIKFVPQEKGTSWTVERRV